MREKYPQLPCIVVAHGKIEGASIGKGLKIGPGQGLSFSRDDLRALKADYIAFGDIHEPQRIEGTRAWYAGSIYPLDFGEGHKAGCWAISVSCPGAPALAERISFPHPIKRHIISSGECAEEVPGMHGECVWYEIRCTKEEAATLDADIILSRLMGHGAS
ncbi:MAG: metallophosphoesterase family protein, partial [Coriobacteriia bacterium]